MVETAFALLLVGGAIAVSLNATASMHTAQKVENDRIRGQLLAINLLTEIMAQPYQERSGTPTFGLEAGESGTTRAAFDDVDDYKAYQETSIAAKDGSAVNGCSGWTRTVTITRTDPSNFSLLAMSDLGVKKITVTVKARTRTLASVAAIKSGAMPPAGEAHQIQNVSDYMKSKGTLN